MKSLFIHHSLDRHADTSLPDPHQDTFSKSLLGFWFYLMADCILFATLFTTYAVLHNNTFGGPSSRDLFSLHLPLIETMILLLSSTTCGLALISASQNKKKLFIAWFSLTFLLGATFITIELNEFAQLIQEGNSWRRSAFLSSFFTLVGTHGLHLFIGLLWMIIVVIQVLLQGITATTFRRIALCSMYWHFLDLIWVFIFTFVYLMGVL